jgi:hypothetical protein
VLHGCPPSQMPGADSTVVTPFHHLSGDSHLHRSIGAGPLRHLVLWFLGLSSRPRRVFGALESLRLHPSFRGGKKCLVFPNSAISSGLSAINFCRSNRGRMIDVMQLWRMTWSRSWSEVMLRLLAAPNMPPTMSAALLVGSPVKSGTNRSTFLITTASGCSSLGCTCHSRFLHLAMVVK